MMFYYPAVFRQKEDGTYHAYFPDLAMCTAEGETLDDCINDAIEACRTWIQVELEETMDLPYVSDPEDIPMQEGDFVRTIGVTIRLYDGWDE
ncbi:MAG: type II toxin-antitoxin system HicB family antitoxin [Lachnospiraceae bacterium]|nr:type II toxin-antitoxin system HicB family antitoxin [Lachnospiraceae bacterium]